MKNETAEKEPYTPLNPGIGIRTLGRIAAKHLYRPERTIAELEMEIKKMMIPASSVMPGEKTDFNGYFYRKQDGTVHFARKVGAQNPEEFFENILLDLTLSWLEKNQINTAHNIMQRREFVEYNFLRASVISAGDTPRLYDEFTGEFFETIKEAKEILKRQMEPPRTFFFAAKEVRLLEYIPSTAEIFEGQFNDKVESDFDVYEFNGVPELNSALREFYEKNTEKTTFQPDYSRVVLLKPEKI